MQFFLDFKQNRIDKANSEKEVPTLVTFLGFLGYTSCMSSIAAEAIKSGYRHIEASPKNPEEYNLFRNFFAKIDAYSMKKSAIHIGLGSISKQASAANISLAKQLLPQTPIVLCGHSQGGLIAIEFWRQFAEYYNVKGIITLSCPLQGASILKSLSSHKILKNAANNSIRRKFFNTKVLPFIIPYLIFPVAKAASRLVCPSLKDVLPPKSIRNKYLQVYNSLKKANMPFLNILASCPGPDLFYESSFGYEGLKEIIGGGSGKESDNILALDDQTMPISWSTMKELNIKADHGLYRIEGYHKVFNHPYTLKAVNSFCSEFLRV